MRRNKHYGLPVPFNPPDTLTCVMSPTRAPPLLLRQPSDNKPVKLKAKQKGGNKLITKH